MLGYVAQMIKDNPGIVEKTTLEGEVAQRAGKPIEANPYIEDGPYGWWRDGWFKTKDS